MNYCHISNYTTQQSQNVCITFVQRRPNVFDVGPTLYKCYTNVLCLLGRGVIQMMQIVYIYLLRFDPLFIVLL